MGCSRKSRETLVPSQLLAPLPVGEGAGLAVEGTGQQRVNLIIIIWDAIQIQAVIRWVCPESAERAIRATILHLVESHLPLRGLGHEGCPGHNNFLLQYIVCQCHTHHASTRNCSRKEECWVPRPFCTLYA